MSEFSSKSKEKNSSKTGLSSNAAASVNGGQALPPSTLLNGTASSDAGSSPSGNVVIEYAMRGETDKLIQCYDDVNEPNHNFIGMLVGERGSADGRNPLDWAALMGHSDFICELIRRGGVDVNAVTEKGYSAAHYAAAWGQVDSLRALIENGANVQLKNSYNETPRDTAQRYSKYPCIEYIDWSIARKALRDAVWAVKDQMSVTDKTKVLTKEEKIGVNTVVTENLAWLEKITDETTTDDLIRQKQAFDEYIQPIISKLPVTAADNATTAAEKSAEKV